MHNVEGSEGANSPYPDVSPGSAASNDKSSGCLGLLVAPGLRVDGPGLCRGGERVRQRRGVLRRCRASAVPVALVLAHAAAQCLVQLPIR